MADIFISYSSKHRDLIEKLAALIRQEGYTVWWDYDLESWGSYQRRRIGRSSDAAVHEFWFGRHGDRGHYRRHKSLEMVRRTGRAATMRATQLAGRRVVNISIAALGLT
jgi:hypothetical protein